MIKIKTIDGISFAQMFISGANNLYNNKKSVDDLNVFPVPDGDTGTNMSLTINAMSEELQQKPSSSVSEAADLMSFATLRGARGNSGVILSQIFRGISKQLKGKATINAHEFSAALANGSQAAYKAVMKPTEGTILTVAREAAAGAAAKSDTDEDIISVLKAACEHGNKALEKTTHMLPALKEANVVDAGGQGWMIILQGALYYLEQGEPITKNDNAAPGENIKEASADKKQINTEDIKFGYCTEFLIQKTNSSIDACSFKKAISHKGDCMLVIDDDDVVKVHIHSNNPGEILEEALKLGELINIKIDNMKHQHNSIIQETKTIKEKPAKKEVLNKYGFVAVCAGKGLSEILKDIGVTRIIEGGQTMNPSADDILRAINKSKAENVFVFPNNKNIIMAANQAKELSDVNVIVIPTKNIPECINAMMVFTEAVDLKKNEEAMLSAVSRVTVGQVTFAVRDTSIKGKTIKKGDILGLRGSEIKYVGKTPEAVCTQLTCDMCSDENEFITVYCGKSVRREQIEILENKLEELFPDCDIEMKKGGQPLYYYIVAVE